MVWRTMAEWNTKGKRVIKGSKCLLRDPREIVYLVKIRLRRKATELTITIIPEVPTGITHNLAEIIRSMIMIMITMILNRRIYEIPILSRCKQGLD